MSQSPLTSTPNTSGLAGVTSHQHQQPYMQFEPEFSQRQTPLFESTSRSNDDSQEILSHSNKASESSNFVRNNYGNNINNNNNNNNNNNERAKPNKFDCPPSPQSSNSSQTQNDDFIPDSAARNRNSSSPASPMSSYNSSFGSNSGKKLMLNSSANSITSQVPGGVVTTQNISTVIRPRSNNNSLQFVKIQTPELSKKAVEQIRIVEETKMSREKIKEVEEEWQNNLINWKSKRRQQFAHIAGSNNEFSSSYNNLYGNDDNNEVNSGRKIKTFAEMIEERAKSGNRLGFHMQRYIGSADGDDDDSPLSGIVSGVEASDQDEIKSFVTNLQLVDHTNPGRSDSTDGEALSSTSSGYNRIDSKSSDSPDNLFENSRAVNSRNVENAARGYKCDNSVDEPNSSKTNELKSTRKDLTQLSENFNSLNISKTKQQEIHAVPLDSRENGSETLVDSSNKGRSHATTHSQGSDNSCYEEDEDEQDEEEEEQKHLQRVAFEAKLKAFEKLTKPAPAEVTKVISNRPQTKPSIRQPKPINSSSKNNKDIHNDLKHNDATTTTPITSASNKPRSGSKTDDRVKLTSQEAVAPREDSTYEVPDDNVESLATPINGLQNSNQPQLQTRSTTKESVVAPMLAQPKTQQAQPSQQSQRLQPHPEQQSQIQRIQIQPPQIQPSQIQPSQIQPPQIQPPQIQPPQVQQLPMQQQAPPQKPQHNTPSKQLFMSQSKSHSQPEQQQPPMSHRKTNSKDDKDKSILSVSGKKRCSSCKEELGRGAAAFVVESLSLVYHTNCFRCSVCHVNLSNGFRGVDVRVHAGALHCQNCYSKDGLNYSRV